MQTTGAKLPAHNVVEEFWKTMHTHSRRNSKLGHVHVTYAHMHIPLKYRVLNRTAGILVLQQIQPQVHIQFSPWPNNTEKLMTLRKSRDNCLLIFYIIIDTLASQSKLALS